MNEESKAAKQKTLDRIIKIQKDLKEVEVKLNLALHRIDTRWVGDVFLSKETDDDLVVLDVLSQSMVHRATTMVEF